MTTPNGFNFRHVMHRLGIPVGDADDSWPVGKILADLAKKRGFPVDRILTEKTDPEPTVRAPHCICHYPLAMFDEACDRVREFWGDRSRQQDLFDKPD